MDVITSVLSADGTKKGILVEVNEVFTGLNDSRFCSNRYSSRSYGEKYIQNISYSKQQTEHGRFLALHLNQVFLSSKFIIIPQKLDKQKKAMTVAPS